MSSEVLVDINGVSKCFYIYKRPVDRIKEYVLPGERVLHDSFWALKNVDFSVYKGETLGIVGPNGSGKSTLLEIIAGTQNATEGSVKVAGRIAALLELGAGFNPEFNGRENIYMNAAVMGLSRAEIDEKYNDIVDFAELGDYISRPVRTYSSGMYVRLAFATAVHMEPEILIVDEALAVGDIRFQRKCFRLFEEFKRAEKTILFVTHATDLITTHCDRAIFLNAGQIHDMGDPRDVIHTYLTFMFGKDQSKDASNTADKRPEEVSFERGGLNRDPEVDACPHRRHYNPTEYRWGDQRAKIIDYIVKSSGQDQPILCERGRDIEVLMSVYFEQDLQDIIYGLTIKTVDGITVYGANTRSRHARVTDRKAGELAIVRFQLQLNLLPGEYFVSMGVAVDDRSVDNLAIDRRYDLFLLSVDGDRADFGVADLCAEVEEMNADASDFGQITESNATPLSATY